MRATSCCTGRKTVHARICRSSPGGFSASAASPEARTHASNRTRESTTHERNSANLKIFLVCGSYARRLSCDAWGVGIFEHRGIPHEHSQIWTRVVAAAALAPAISAHRRKSFLRRLRERIREKSCRAGQRHRGVQGRRSRRSFCGLRHSNSSRRNIPTISRPTIRRAVLCSRAPAARPTGAAPYLPLRCSRWT